jgi:hypothetical protein
MKETVHELKSDAFDHPSVHLAPSGFHHFGPTEEVSKCSQFADGKHL